MIETKGITSSANRIARLLTILFNPFFLPIYGLLLILLPDTIFSYLSFQSKKALFLLVLLDNILFPFLILAYMKGKKIVTTWLLEDRKERIIPIFLTAFCYTLTVYMIWRLRIPLFIRNFLVAMVVIALFVGIVSLWKKISIHSTGMGALLAIILSLSIKTGVPLVGWIVAITILTALVMSARLWLNAHTPREIWFGLLAGVSIMSVILLFL